MKARLQPLGVGSGPRNSLDAISVRAASEDWKRGYTALEKLEQDLALTSVTWHERDSSPLSEQFLFSFVVPHLLRQVALIAQFFDQVHLGFEKIHVTLFVFEQGNQ